MVDNKRKRQRQVEIYLVNDDTTTFQHVIEALSSTLPECSTIRAEQIATITHRTGMCHIYTGKSNVAIMIQTMLIARGLKIITKFK
jgi:ATP-dependent Clp protease adapter protein ClpS